MAHLIGYRIVFDINNQYLLESTTFFRRKRLSTKKASDILNEYAANAVSMINAVFDADFDITDIKSCGLIASDGNIAEIYNVDFARVVKDKIDVTISSESDDWKLLRIGR